MDQSRMASSGAGGPGSEGARSPRKDVFAKKDSKEPPRIDAEKIQSIGGLWDPSLRMVAGNLCKQKKGLFGRGGWDRRFFVIDPDIDQRKNYQITYYYKKSDFHEDRQSGKIVELAKAQVLAQVAVSDKSKKYWEFQLVLPNREPLLVAAESEEEYRAWVVTLQYVIEVANARAVALLQLRQGLLKAVGASAKVPAGGVAAKKAPITSGRGLRNPIIRLDVDVNSLPPESDVRYQFLEAFRRDVAAAVGLAVDRVQIVRIKRSPDMDWLTIVEFFFTPTQEVAAPGGQMMKSPAPDAGELEQRYRTLRQKLLDQSSDLYRGSVTCHIDATYVHVPLSDDEVSRGAVKLLAYSPDPRVRALLEKYIPEPGTGSTAPAGADAAGGPAVDAAAAAAGHDALSSRFTVHLEFEGKTRPLLVLNPRVFRRKVCMVWPHEVKQALGITGTVQDAWLEPLSLTPMGVPQEVAFPLFFEPQPTSNGFPVIDARLLKAGVTYAVEFQDDRREVLESMSMEEVQAIEDTFTEYDVNGDQVISREEYVNGCKRRSAAMRAKIDQQFDGLVSGVTRGGEGDGPAPAVDPALLDQAEKQRQQQYQRLADMEARLLKMFDKADVDGDGTLTIQEFYLAEAWWRRSALNPERIQLF